MPCKDEKLPSAALKLQQKSPPPRYEGDGTTEDVLGLSLLWERHALAAWEPGSEVLWCV